MVTEVKNKENFESLLKDAGDKLVVVDFTAAWCGPCRKIAPTLTSWAKEDFTDVVFLKVDVDDNEDIAAEYGVTAMPTFIFFRNGARCDNVKPVVGGDENNLKKAIEDNRASK